MGLMFVDKQMIKLPFVMISPCQMLNTNSLLFRIKQCIDDRCNAITPRFGYGLVHSFFFFAACNPDTFKSCVLLH